MKRSYVLSSVFALFAESGTIHAEGSYLGFGGGLIFDLGRLGVTITNDGLNGVSPVPNNVGTNAYSPGGTGTVPTGTGIPGTTQQVIIPENELIMLKRNSGGFISEKHEGAMHGLNLVTFFESEGQNTFWRVGALYTKKILGGYSESKIGGLRWYEAEWDYKALVVPAYYGFKAGIGEAATLYIGAGINYFRGGWKVGGMNWADYVAAAMPSASSGSFSYLDPVTGVSKSGTFVNEDIYMNVSGVGFNVVLGMERKLESGAKAFFEIENIMSGDYAVGTARTRGVMTSMAPYISKMVVIGGTNYTFGYKMPM